MKKQTYTRGYIKGTAYVDNIIGEGVVDSVLRKFEVVLRNKELTYNEVIEVITESKELLSIEQRLSEISRIPQTSPELLSHISQRVVVLYALSDKLNEIEHEINMVNMSLSAQA